MKEAIKINRNIICIDLKSFFATVECVERNLDPFTTPLVVAEPNRDGAITLAVTPYMKKLGVKSRGRIFEIPKNVEYITVRPRMGLYIEKSKEVIDIYLNYVSCEDLHIYSIDECFLDITNYTKLYKIPQHQSRFIVDFFRLVRQIESESAPCTFVILCFSPFCYPVRYPGAKVTFREDFGINTRTFTLSLLKIPQYCKLAFQRKS